MTVRELMESFWGLVNDGNAEMDTVVMLSVDGRWTGILGISTGGEQAPETLFIESQDL